VVRRVGSGPTRERDGALVKVTLKGDRDLCWRHGCALEPAVVITYHGQRVWVCQRDRKLDGEGPGPLGGPWRW